MLPRPILSSVQEELLKFTSVTVLNFLPEPQGHKSLRSLRDKSIPAGISCCCAAILRVAVVEILCSVRGRSCS